MSAGGVFRTGETEGRVVREPLAAWVLVLMLVAGAARAAGVDALDAENGFRGARFGERLEQIAGLELLSERGAEGTRIYVRPSEPLVYGGARLDGVTYGFHEGELYFVALLTSGRANADALLAALVDAYGTGTPVPGSDAEFLWQGAKVRLHFRRDPATGMGMVGLTSLPIDARVRAERVSLPARVDAEAEAARQRGAGAP